MFRRIFYAIPTRWMMAAGILIPCLGAPRILQAQSVDTSVADSIISRFARENGLPGLTVAIATDEGIVYSRAEGFADLENRVQANEETLFRIASVTKPLTATAVMQLVEEGRMGLDEPIDTYCPVYRVNATAPTARHLMAHLGGVPDYTQIRGGVWHIVTRGGTVHGSNPYHFASIEEVVQTIAPDTLISVPGQEYHYSNIGYLLLGCAIEGASGTEYAEYMATNVFAPAGMTRTQPDNAYRIIPNRARPYQGRTERDADWWWWTPVQKEVMEVGTLYNARFEDTSLKLSAGGMMSTAKDLVRFGRAILDGTLVDSRTWTDMMTIQQPADGSEASWGLGFSVATVEGEGVVGLSGMQPGASAVIRIIPGAGFVMAAITNRDRVSLSPLLAELGRLWGRFPGSE